MGGRVERASSEVRKAKTSKSSKRRASDSSATKEEAEIVPRKHDKKSSASKGDAEDPERRKLEPKKKASLRKSQSLEDLINKAQSMDRVRRKKKSHRDRVGDTSRTTSERHIRRKRVKDGDSDSSERRARQAGEEETKKSPTATPSPSTKRRAVDGAVNAAETVAGTTAGGGAADAAKESAPAAALSEEVVRAQLEMDKETVQLVQAMQAQMVGLEEALRQSQEQNRAMEEKLAQMNIDIRDVQLHVKKLNKQHADEVVDRFKQYERLFSTSIATVQGVSEKCIATVQTSVKGAVEAVLAGHRESLQETLQKNLEDVHKAGEEHLAGLRKQLAADMEELTARATRQHEELAASLGQSASSSVNAEEVTKRLVEGLVEEAMEALASRGFEEDERGRSIHRKCRRADLSLSRTDSRKARDIAAALALGEEKAVANADDEVDGEDGEDGPVIHKRSRGDLSLSRTGSRKERDMQAEIAAALALDEREKAAASKEEPTDANTTAAASE